MVSDAWLRRVVHNKVIDKYRQAAHFITIPLEQVLETGEDELTPEEHVIQQERYEVLRQTVKQLPPMQQQIIRLRFGNGLRLTEIAHMLNKSEGTVRKDLSRILHHLRSIYEQKEKEEMR